MKVRRTVFQWAPCVNLRPLTLPSPTRLSSSPAGMGQGLRRDVSVASKFVALWGTAASESCFWSSIHA